MNRRSFLTAGVILGSAGCLGPLRNRAKATGTPCPSIETDASCDPMKQSIIKAESGAPVDSYRSSILLSVESLPACERALAKRAIDEGAVRFCGTGPSTVGSFARRASEAAEDHELYLAYEGTGYRLYIQIEDQVFVG